MPTMPNFIRIEQLTAKREQGYKELPTIPVSDLSKEEAEEYAEEMKTEFLRHWKLKTIKP